MPPRRDKPKSNNSTTAATTSRDHVGGNNYKKSCDLCARKRVKCSGRPVSGGKCASCEKKNAQCRFGVRMKPGPKGSRRGKSSGGGDRRSARRVSSAVVMSTSAEVGGTGSSGGDGRAVGRSSPPSEGAEEATTGERAAAVGPLADGGINIGGGSEAGGRLCLDGSSGVGVAAANSSWLGEKKSDEVEYAMRSPSPNLTDPPPRLPHAAGGSLYWARSSSGSDLPDFSPFFDESGGGGGFTRLTGKPGNGGGVVDRESYGGGERTGESASCACSTVAGRVVPFSAHAVEGSASGGGGGGGVAAVHHSASLNVGGGSTGGDSIGTHRPSLSRLLEEVAGDENPGFLEMASGVVPLGGAPSGGGDAGAADRVGAPEVTSREHSGGPDGNELGKRLSYGVGGGAAAVDRSRTLYSTREGVVGVARGEEESGAHHLGGGSLANLLGLSPTGPVPTFGGRVGNRNGNTCAEAGTRSSFDAGVFTTTGLHHSNNTCSGLAAAVSPPFPSQSSGYLGNQASAPRVGSLGTARSGRPFVDGLSSLAQKNDRTALHSFPPHTANIPLRGKGGSGSGGGGGGGSFRGCLPASPLQEGDLKRVLEIFGEDYASEQQQQQQQTKKQKAEQQPPKEPESRCAWPVDAPLKRSKNPAQAGLTTARKDRTAAAAGTATISTPELAAAAPQQSHYQQPERPLFSHFASNMGVMGNNISRMLFSSRSFLTLDSGGGSGGGAGVDAGSVAADISDRFSVRSGDWQGHGGSPLDAALLQAGGDNDTRPGNKNCNGLASVGVDQCGDVASQVDWESMYGPSGSFVAGFFPLI